MHSARADESSCANSATVASADARIKSYSKSVPSDVPRIELAARLCGRRRHGDEDYERCGRTPPASSPAVRTASVTVSADEFHKADEAIARQYRIDNGTLPRPSFAETAKSPGRPQIEGLNIIYLNPLGDPAHANAWKNIIAHETEGPPGTARREATDQFANPTKRGVMLWVETDGTVYWSTAENVIPTHTDGADRNDNKFIDNSKTYHAVIKTNSIGVEFIGNYPDVAKPVTAAQMQAWFVLVPFLQERYGIPPIISTRTTGSTLRIGAIAKAASLARWRAQLGHCPSKRL